MMHIYAPVIGNACGAHVCMYVCMVHVCVYGASMHTYLFGGACGA